MKNPALLFLCCITILHAQVDEKLTVTLRDLRVHVLDKDGNPVKGLKASDFEVLEDRKPIQLAAFSEVSHNARANAEASDVESAAKTENEGDLNSPKGRTMLVYFDSSLMSPDMYEASKAAIQQFFERRITGDDKVKLVQVDQGMVHLTPFTSDISILNGGLAKAVHTGSMRQRMLSIENQLVNNYELFKLNEPPVTAEEAQDILKGRASNLRVVGRNGLAVSENDNGSGGMRVADDMEPYILKKQELANEIFRVMDEKEFHKAQHYKTYHGNMLALCKILAGIRGSKIIYQITGGGYLQSAGQHDNTLSMAQELGEYLNAANITIYPLLATKTEPVTAEVFKTSSLYVEDAMGSWVDAASWASDENRKRKFPAGSYSNTLFENEVQIQSSPSIAAAATGGLFKRVYGLSKLEETLSALDDAARNYYRLAYTIDQKGSTSKVKINLKNGDKDWELHYGDTFRKPKPFSKLTDEEKQLGFEVGLLYGGITQNDLECEYGFQIFPAAKETPIAIYASMPVVKFPKKGVEVGYAAFDSNHGVLDVTKTTVLDPGRTKEVFIYNVLVTEQIPAYVRYYLRNLDNGEVSIHQSDVSEAAPVDGKLRLSELAFCTPETHLKPILINHLETKGQEGKDLARKDLDPFILDGGFVKPNLSAAYKKPKEVEVFFHLNNVKGDIRTHQLQITLLQDQKPLQAKAQLQAFSQTGEGSYRLSAFVDTSTLPSGEYEVYVRAATGDQAEVTEKRATFTISGT